MRIKVDDIKPEGVSLQETWPLVQVKEVFAKAAIQDFRPQGDCQVLANFSRLKGAEVLVRGKLQSDVAGVCGRCLEEVPLSLPVDFTLNYVPKSALALPPVSKKGSDEDEDAGEVGSFQLSEADLEPYDGKFIELDAVLKEQLLLALPAKVLCKDDCQGLCASCGKNRNEGPCGCTEAKLESPLAGLKNLKLN